MPVTDLPGGSDGNITVGTVIGARGNFPGEERADLTQAGYGRARCEHRSTGVEDDPHFAVP